MLFQILSYFRPPENVKQARSVQYLTRKSRLLCEVVINYYLRIPHLLVKVLPNGGMRNSKQLTSRTLRPTGCVVIGSVRVFAQTAIFRCVATKKAPTRKKCVNAKAL